MKTIADLENMKMQNFPPFSNAYIVSADQVILPTLVHHNQH